ncbi:MULTISPECIES: hypothetical protein [Dietzia]|uniref:hypothetical protein n=1 Tax=Dietzia TaxID=37914 RepID=UPI000D087639|nr:MULTISPECIES: hypothetical protein [Dietzia]AVM64244.1 hypothetical protein C3V38_07420 [Dietzia sp. oral taxon 368]MCT1638400.1 hypothetical protein [Dietzia cinnamea]MCT1711395.1 hypothetical protein [Dietzia cinnamea]MCT2272999.1 hypothetical protein [Dietzia cinnamea]
MRSTRRTALAAVLAASALVAGAGTAAAEDVGEKGTVGGLTPVEALETLGGSLGYGSLGTGSLMDLVSLIVSTGSAVLSLEIPNATGSYAPGSLGSYGPEASLGHLSATLTGSLGPGS